MDFLTKQKTLIAIIFVLVILNISTLAFLWFAKPVKPSYDSFPPPNRNEFLAKEMGLTDEQETAFNQLHKIHFDKMKTMNEAINKKRKELREESLRVEAAPAKIEQIASEIGKLHYEFEIYMSSHFIEVKKILNKEQVEIFNMFLEKAMMNRHSAPLNAEKKVPAHLPPPPQPPE